MVVRDDIYLFPAALALALFLLAVALRQSLDEVVRTSPTSAAGTETHIHVQINTCSFLHGSSSIYEVTRPMLIGHV